MLKLFTIAIVTLITSSNLLAQDDRQLEGNLEVAEFYSFQSDILSEKQTFSVFLPPSYNAPNSIATYPVVYVLDGYSTQALAVASTMRANNQMGAQVPEAIIIGLPSNNRTRDYTPVYISKGRDGVDTQRFEASGHAERYRKYLREELFPLINKHYRTKQHRILVGHSFGGLFALNDLFSQGRLFQGYVAIDPIFWIGDRYLDKMVTDASRDQLDFGGSLYVSTVPHNDDGSDAASAKLLSDQVQIKKSPKFSMKLHDHSGENHQSIQPVSYNEGLRFVFDGYAAPSVEKVARNPKLLTKHYKAYSERIGAVYTPDRSYVTMAAYNALYEFKLPTEALKLFKMNVEAYPNSSGVWTGLGDYYAHVREVKMARESFDKALLLNGNNAYAL